MSSKDALLKIYFFTLATACFGYVPNLLHPYTSALVKLSEYDSTVRPPGLAVQDDPVNVTVNMYVINIESVDHIKNEFKIQIYLREEWIDSRLSFKDYDRDVSTNEVQLFWKPDFFFSNEKRGYFHTITKPNAFAKLRKNGYILLSSRISLTLSCPMNLRAFPFDTQFCPLYIESYGYTADDLAMSWKNENPLQVSKDLSIPGYTWQKTETHTSHDELSSGKFTRLEATFEFKRNSLPYVIRIFIPLALLVVASWTSFWLPSSAVLPRLTVGAITTLTTALLTFREEEFLRLPSVTSLDIWVGVSAFFVFAAFFQYILVVTLQGDKDIIKHTELFGAEDGKPKKSGKILWIALPQNVAVADAVARVAFPVSYIVFHVIFGPFLF